jgi:hypothetical protein
MTSENDIKGLVSLKFLRPWPVPYTVHGHDQLRVRASVLSGGGGEELQAGGNTEIET